MITVTLFHLFLFRLDTIPTFKELKKFEELIGQIKFQTILSYQGQQEGVKIRSKDRGTVASSYCNLHRSILTLPFWVLDQLEASSGSSELI